MDIMIPNMDGHQAAKAIRALGIERSDAVTIPIIALSANAFIDDIQESLNSGMNDHISKPINMEELIDTITKCIKHDQENKEVNSDEKFALVLSDAKAQVSYDYDTGRITTFLISTQHQQDTSVMDIRPLAEAVMETAGKIKNDNMSDQDFYKFQFDGVMDMKIREVNENKKQFISLLLLADEQESMVDHYLEKGTMYVLEDGNVKAECVVTDEGNEILEIKNIAVDPENQGKGYGKALIDFLASKYADEYSILQVGTGDSPLTIPFYEKCGFVRSHNIPNFFTDNYDHPIYEGGVQLIDMVYLQRCL